MKVLCSVAECPDASYVRGWCIRHYGRWKAHGDPLICLNKMAKRGEPFAWIKSNIPCQSNECLVWPFVRYPSGHAQIYLDGRGQVAARVVCQMTYGDPPSDRHEAAHSCGRGHEACINQRHLRWATPEQNQADRILHGTSNRGSRNGRSTLPESDVKLIYERILSGESQEEIASDFQVSAKTISNIKTGSRWGWLTGASS